MEQLQGLMDIGQELVEEGLRGEIRGSSFRMDWLRSAFVAGTATDDPAVAVRTARAYLLYVLGSSLFADKSGNRVVTHWLEFIQDIGQVGTYAWGAAVLAYMYKQLGQAALQKTRQIGGYMTLLEV